MPYLTDLQGRPLSWETLHARNEAYWAHREVEEQADFPDMRTSGLCKLSQHYRCSGRMARDLEHHSRLDLIPCQCPCH